MEVFFFFFKQYLLSRLVALTAANTLVFKARPAMGMDNCWLKDESWEIIKLFINIQ